ncbi:heavy metal-binding domain-containing protein [Celeribacter indicus]
MGLELYIGPPRDLPDANQPPVANPDDFANIPLHEASLAAGGGRANGDEFMISSLAFRRDWLGTIGISPANAVLARVEGESMQPTVWAGDMVVIDLAKKEIPVRKGKAKKGRSPVYAILDDGHARESALDELRKEARALGADAVVGIDLDYSEISGASKSMLFLGTSSTAVKLAET